MISLLGVSVRAGGFVLPVQSFTIQTGEYAVLMGRTGSGKTTLLEAVAGLREVVSGTVELMGRNVTHMVPAARHVGYVPQDLALFPSMTVAEHLSFALELRKSSEEAIRLRRAELADLLGIESLLGRLPQGLSGGESQRVALGRALSFRPPVLLLDEPLSALDEETRGEMVALLKRVQVHEGVTVMHVTHSRAEARALADRLMVLEGGIISEEVGNDSPRGLHGSVTTGGRPGLGRGDAIQPGNDSGGGGGGGGG